MGTATIVLTTDIGATITAVIGGGATIGTATGATTIGGTTGGGGIITAIGTTVIGIIVTGKAPARATL